MSLVLVVFVRIVRPLRTRIVHSKRQNISVAVDDGVANYGVVEGVFEGAAGRCGCEEASDGLVRDATEFGEHPSGAVDYFAEAVFGGAVEVLIEDYNGAEMRRT